MIVNPNTQVWLEHRAGIRQAPESIANYKQFFPQVNIKAVDRKARTATFTVNTLALDSYREIVMPEGMDSARYESNPVFLAGHNWYSLDAVLGKAVSIKADPNEIEMQFLFATEENPAAATAFELVSGGFLNATSIGFRPLAWVDSVDQLSEEQQTRVIAALNRQGKTTGDADRIYTKWELLEVSLVIIPANPEALGKASRGECGPVAELVAKMFETKKADPVRDITNDVIRAIERGFNKVKNL